MTSLPSAGPLFDPPPKLRRSAPATSRMAAARVAPASGKQREAVYEYLKSKKWRGATNAEISEGLAMKLQSVCPRCLELREAGRVVSANARRGGGEVWKTKEQS